MKRGNVSMAFSVSATNRPPREGEVDGVNYYFLSTAEFKKAIADNAFIEYEEVYPGRFYGTLKSEVQHRCEAGENVLLDIDVKGGVRVKNMFGATALSIFIMPPSLATLEQRLRNRATDDDKSIRQRLSKAEYEISFADSYDMVIVNDDLRTAADMTESEINKFLNA